MQHQAKPTFLCVTCGKKTGDIRYISAVGNVCPSCSKRYASFSRLIDFVELLTCDRGDDQSVNRFRRAIRVLQLIGQKYEVSEDGSQLEVVEQPSRRKLVLENSLKEEARIIALLREHEADV